MKHILTRFRKRFRPLTGMVLPVRLVRAAIPGFRPLTGMVPALACLDDLRDGFRPLTGMVH